MGKNHVYGGFAAVSFVESNLSLCPS